MNDYNSGDDEDGDIYATSTQPVPNVPLPVDPQVALRAVVEARRRDITAVRRIEQMVADSLNQSLMAVERNFGYQSKSYKEQVENEVRAASRRYEPLHRKIPPRVQATLG